MKRMSLLIVAAGVLLLSSACVPTAQPGQASIVVSGGIHSCAVLGDQTVRCWGNNGYGQLGNGTVTDSTVPVVATGVTGVTVIAAGEHHTCVVAPPSVSCWGRNDSGQLGNGTVIGSSPAVSVGGLLGITALAAGRAHTCGLVGNNGPGAVWCWGAGSSGQLGNDLYTPSSVPVAVSGLTDAIAIGAGADTTCAVRSTRTVVCWGDNTSGKLGNGSNVLKIGVPSPVSGLTDAVDVSPGYRHTCSHTTTGLLWCWGDESIGQLGNGVAVPSAFSNVPIAVAIPLVALVSSGSDFTCATLALQGVNCWGRNDLGQIGDGSTTPRTVPTAPGINGVVTTSAGDGHVCVRTNTSNVRCWGWNGFGQLGDGTTTNRLTSVEVTGL